MEKSVKELKSDLVDVSLRITNIIHEEKIDQDAKDELEMIATDLYYFGTKKDKKKLSDQEMVDYGDFLYRENKEARQEIKDISEGSAGDIDRIVQTYQIEDKEAELLEDVCTELLSIKEQVEPQIKWGTYNVSLDKFL